MDEYEQLNNGYRVLKFGDVNSTNNTALEHASKSDPGKLWIKAERQLNGKGSRGRGWVSEKGNLYTSLLLREDKSLQQISYLTFVASIAIYECLTKFLPKEKLALKWPNDVLYDGAKISGILLESHVKPNETPVIIIGMGINCQHHPGETSYRATNIAATGENVSPDQVFQELTAKMHSGIEFWCKETSFTNIRKKWMARAIGIGKSIKVEILGKSIHGIFEDLDENGRLILIDKYQIKHEISVGDVFFSN